MPILVTGAAGFIGHAVAQKLLDRGETVVGLDNLNSYYDVGLKEHRLSLLNGRSGFRFVRVDVADRTAMAELFAQHRFDRVVHLAAQAGVRYSLENPAAYIDSNVVGFGAILEGCRAVSCRHLVFASSSSVYGANTLVPFSERHAVDHPVSLYAATKKANELMAHTYAHLYGLPMTGLRFFTVYGPLGRPDMAYFSFTKQILAGEPIDVFNHGEMSRDFTYIDDIVDGVIAILDRPAQPDAGFDAALPNPATSTAPYRLYNIGNNQPVALMKFIATLERAIGRQAEIRLKPMQPGDVRATHADLTALQEAISFTPSTPLIEGLARFVAWYRSYYG